jgi:hypothetical protein
MDPQNAAHEFSNEEVQARSGTSFFQHIQISWHLSDDFGLTVSHLRCGLCLAPLESYAITLENDLFLICENGHLVGNEIAPEIASAKSIAIRLQYQNEVQNKKRQYFSEYHRYLNEVIAGSRSAKEFRDWETDVPSRDLLPRFSSRHEYNNKLEKFVSLFREAHAQKKHLRR